MNKETLYNKLTAGMAFFAIVGAIVLATLLLIGLARGLMSELPPLPIEQVPLTIEDCVVKVEAVQKEHKHYGKGVVVEANGMTFILTSQMIFVGGFEEIIIGAGEWTATGEVIATSKEWGLVALACEPGFSRGWPISDAPSIPPQTESTAVTATERMPVEILDYINDNWFMITGVDENYVGVPLMNGEDITGIIVGQNQANMQETIAVANWAIREFCDQVTLTDAPITWRIE